MKNKLTARELSSFCGQMGMLLHSGISTAEGLHILCDESKTDADRQILTPLIRSVEENGSLSRALDESGVFPSSMTAYVRTGEETGCLDEIMESLSSLCFSDPRRSPHWLHPVFQSYGKRPQPAAKNGHPSPVFP